MTRPTAGDPASREAPGRGIEDAVRRAGELGRPAIAAFLTAGYPDRAAFRATLERVAATADLVEVGVPFSDPMADGVTIQRASREALAAGVTLPWILEEVRQARVAAPILLMSYLNPLLSFGLRRLADAAPASGVSGLIVPDLPWEESGELRDLLDAHGIALVQLVTPLTPAGRLARLCGASRGFVYAVTRTGTTGAASDIAEATGFLDRVRAVSELPVLAGFGVRGPDQVRSLAGHVDGVIVGSALVERLALGEDPSGFLSALRDACEVVR